MIDIGTHGKCPVCKEWGWSGTHRCGPSFQVRPEDYDDEDAATVYASSAEKAATKYLDARFADFDYPNSMTVVVFNDVQRWTFEIEVEAEPVFYATEIKREAIEPVEEASEDAS